MHVRHAAGAKEVFVKIMTQQKLDITLLPDEITLSWLGAHPVVNGAKESFSRLFLLGIIALPALVRNSYPIP